MFVSQRRSENRARFVSVALVALAASALSTAIAGCGGGSSAVAVPTRLVVSNPLVTTTPNPFTRAGGTVVVQVTVQNASAQSGKAPQVDVRDTTGRSLVGGPQLLTSLSSRQNGYAYQFTVPANSTTTAQVYTVVVTGQTDTGNAGNTPFTVGTITVPR